MAFKREGKPRNSLVIRQNQRFTLLIYHQGSSIDLIPISISPAWNSRRPDKGLLFHSDRGSQYCSRDFIRALRTRQCLQNMSSTGNCYDNAITETFFKTLRAELTYHVSFKGRDDARKEIFSYIELFYNRKRLQQLY